MPVVAAALPAILTTVATVGGAALAAHSQNKAINNATEATTAASEAALAEQRRQYDQTRADYAPWRLVGQGALQQLARTFNIRVPDNTFTIEQPAPGGGATASPGPQAGASDTFDPATGAAAPTSAQELVTPGQTAGQAYFAANPDVKAEYDRILPTVDWNSPWAAQHGFVQGDPDAFAAWHYANHGAPEGRPAPAAVAAVYRDVPAASPGATPQSPAQAAAPGVTLDPVTNKPTGMLTTGSNAPAGADRRYGDFFASPDYAFRRDESLRAITGNAQAKGLIDSGALGKGLIDYAGKAASQEFGSWFDRLATLAGYGTTATAGTAAAGAHAADNVSGIIQNQGENLASSITARGGVNAGLITNAAGAAGGLISNIGGAGGGARSVGTIADAFTGGGLAPLPGYVNGLINNLPQPGLFA